MAQRVSPLDYVRGNLPFVTLVVLIVATVLLGGGSRDDIASLVILRPLGVICLGIGLFTLSRHHWHGFKHPLAIKAAIVGLIVIHLIPLPPFIWQSFPGRELAVAAGEAAGGGQPWRPLSLVPYRGWNALYAMAIPAAAMILAVQVEPKDHRKLLYLLIGAAVLSALHAMLQVISGFHSGLYFYRVTNNGSPTGLFANRNHMAALQVCALPLLMVLASRAKGPRKRVVQIGCAALGALAVMIATATGSRAGIALSVVALLACVIIWRARPSPQQARARRDQRAQWVPYAMGGFGLLLLSAFGFLLTYTQSFERVAGGAGGEVEEFRFIVWQAIVDFLPSYLPFGSGVGSFVEVFKVHEPNELLNSTSWNHAHNDWLEWALEGGVPILILIAYGLFAYVRSMVRMVKQTHTGRLDVQLGLAGGTVLFVLGLWSVVDYPLRVPMLAAFAALAAVWVALPGAAQRLQNGASDGSGNPAFKAQGGSFAARPAEEL